VDARAASADVAASPNEVDGPEGDHPMTASASGQIHGDLRRTQTVNRAMRVLLRATEDDQLLQRVCESLVDDDEYELAWIARIGVGIDGTDDADTGVPSRILARAGATDHLDHEIVSWARGPQVGDGPTDHSLATGEVTVIDDLLAEPGPGHEGANHDGANHDRAHSWRDRARSFGIRSSVAIPFQLREGVPAALTICSHAHATFDPTTVDQLVELGRDLEVGLTRLRTLETLVADEQRFRLLAENTGDVVLLTRDGVIEWISPSVRGVLGWSADDLVDEKLEQLVHPDEIPLLDRARGEVRRGVPNTYRTRVRCQDGSWTWIDIRTRPLFDIQGRPEGSVISTVWDTNAAVAAHAALEHAASHDSLTGLANRSLVLDELDRALASSRRTGLRTAVLLVDLDHFKYVNDSLGHAVGDSLLCSAADRMVAAVREGDLVARHGGDEFVVVMRDLDNPEEAIRVADRLTAAFRSPITVADAELYTTASIGAAVSSGGDQDAIDLLREADIAMYRAKDEGRDRWSLFNEDLRDSVDERLRIANELRAAVDHRELEVWFQPEVSLVNGDMRAVEALLRWRHPSGEIYPAALFIETAEETGMILDVGRWVLRRACREAARWLEKHPEHPLIVRVNLSSLQLSEAGLLEDVDDALVSAGLTADRLCVEVTETAMLHETSTVRSNMAGLNRRGVRVAIDDFGTGYASLTYLRRYPIDVVKLDQTFITNLTTRPQDEYIAAGIIEMAARLGISVTAEGVELAEQADLLRALGCSGAQGFLYSPAVPADAVLEMLDRELSRD
jgi:diguanylate cyclase (GGDEF)-like protein/PAS domain S-box-containing protein